jgi:hypothetical protein
MAPATPPEIMRSRIRTRSGSCAMTLRMLSFSVSFSAVSGAILTTFAPLPLKKARKEPVRGRVCCQWLAAKRRGFAVAAQGGANCRTFRYHLLPSLPERERLGPVMCL